MHATPRGTRASLFIVDEEREREEKKGLRSSSGVVARRALRRDVFRREMSAHGRVNARNAPFRFAFRVSFQQRATTERAFLLLPAFSGRPALRYEGGEAF